MCIKIKLARGKSVPECYQILREACGDNALLYRAAARWDKAFHAGRNEIANLQRTDRPFILQQQIDIGNGLFSIDVDGLFGNYLSQLSKSAEDT